MMRIRIAVGCGQRWWRLSSWRGPGLFRKLPMGGFSVGPIMAWREER